MKLTITRVVILGGLLGAACDRTATVPPPAAMSDHAVAPAHAGPTTVSADAPPPGPLPAKAGEARAPAVRPSRPPVQPTDLVEGKDLSGWLAEVRAAREDSWRAGQAVGVYGAAAVPALREMIRDPRDEVRRAAAGALGQVGEAARDALPDIVTALRDRDPGVREKAADALAQFPNLDPAVLPALVVVFAEPIRDTFAGANAVKAAARVGAAAAVPLAAVLRDSDGWVRRRAAETLGLIGPDARPATAALARVAAADPDIEVRREAMFALGRVGGDDAVPALLGIVRDRHPNLLVSAVLALGEARPASAAAVDLLATFLADDRGELQWAAAVALARVRTHSPRSLTALRAALRHSNREIRHFVTLALAAAGPAAADAADLLAERLETEPNSARLTYAYALGRVAPRRAAEATRTLLECAADSSPTVRADAVARLAELAPDAVTPDCVTRLADALLDPATVGKEWAATVLGMLGPRAAAARVALTTAARSTDRGVRRAAATALDRIDGAPTATPTR